MSKVTARDVTFNYEEQGSGESLILIPHLAADHACYAFQIQDYAAHFTCISVDQEALGNPTILPAAPVLPPRQTSPVAAVGVVVGVSQPRGLRCISAHFCSTIAFGVRFSVISDLPATAGGSVIAFAYATASVYCLGLLRNLSAHCCEQK